MAEQSQRTVDSAASLSYMDTLRYIFDQQECQIDSTESRTLRKIVDELCTTQNDEFLTYYEMVDDDVRRIKEKNKKMLFKQMYKYSANTLATYLKGMPQDAIYNHPILWQVRT